MAKKAKTSRKALGITGAVDAMADVTTSIKGAARRRPKRAGKDKDLAAPKRKATTLMMDVAGEARRVEGRAQRAPSRKTGPAKVRLGRLERLEIAIDEVRLGGRTSPRTRKLQLSGIPKMAQKVVEEAGEAAIEAVQGNKAALIAESVDLLYNLLVLLSASGISLSQIWEEMDRRELVLGMAEKLPKTIDSDL